MPQRLRRIVLYGVLLITFLIGVKMGFDRVFKLVYSAKPAASLVKADNPVPPPAAPAVASTTVKEKVDYNPYFSLIGAEGRDFSPYIFYRRSLGPGYVKKEQLPKVKPDPDGYFEINVPDHALTPPLKLGMPAKVFEGSKIVVESSISSVIYHSDSDDRAYVTLTVSPNKAHNGVTILAPTKEDLDKWTEATTSDYTEIVDSETLSGYKAIVYDWYAQHWDALDEYEEYGIIPRNPRSESNEYTQTEILNYVKDTLKLKVHQLNTVDGKMTLVKGLIKDRPSFSASVKDGKIDKFMSTHSIDQTIKFGNELCFMETTWQWNSDVWLMYLVCGDPFAKKYSLIDVPEDDI